MPISQVERDWDLQELLTPTPLPKKKRRKKAIINT
jgi:hypothetical protein